MNEIIINRQDESVIIEYKEKDVGTTNLLLGPKIHNMSDEDILNCHNDCIYPQLESIKIVTTRTPQVGFS